MVTRDAESGAESRLVQMEHDGGMSFASAEARLETLMGRGGTGLKRRAHSLPGFFRSTSNRPGTEVKMVGLAHRAASAAGVVVLRPNGRKGHMDLDNFETRYEAISRDEARELWAVEYRLCEHMCSHGPNCKNRSTCVVGKRMQQRSLLTADDCLASWGRLEAVLGRRKAKLMRVVLGGSPTGCLPCNPTGTAPKDAEALSQRPQGSQLAVAVPARRFIGVEVSCATGDEFGPGVRHQQGAPPTHAQLTAGLVEEMDAESAIG